MNSDVVPSVEPLTVPDLPDPFLRHDSPDAPSSQPFGYASQITLTGPVMDVPLQSETSNVDVPINIPSPPAKTSSSKMVEHVNENKSLPIPNLDAEEAPELYVPGLVVSGLFLPVPNVSGSSRK